MLRIFTEEERKKMGEVKSKDLEYLYPNKAFIMINTRDNITQVNGRKCIFGIIGTLYAMADYEDLDQYTDEIIRASDIPDVADVATFTSFPIKDGVYYVE